MPKLLVMTEEESEARRKANRENLPALYARVAEAIGEVDTEIAMNLAIKLILGVVKLTATVDRREAAHMLRSVAADLLATAQDLHPCGCASCKDIWPVHEPERPS